MYKGHAIFDFSKLKMYVKTTHWRKNINLLEFLHQGIKISSFGDDYFRIYVVGIGYLNCVLPVLRMIAMLEKGSLRNLSLGGVGCETQFWVVKKVDQGGGSFGKPDVGKGRNDVKNNLYYLRLKYSRNCGIVVQFSLGTFTLKLNTFEVFKPKCQI